MEPIDFDTPCDVVALTAFNVQSQRAFAILHAFKARGRVTALGGPFATSSPEVCRPHTDILFLGEGEAIWPEFLQDFAHGQFKNQYMARDKVDLTQAPIPRFELLNLPAYGSGCIQTSRGCPFACEFCDIIMGLLKRLYRIPRFMTKRQGGVLLPATPFVVLQTTQSNVKSAGAGVALPYRAHARLFLRWGRGRTLGFRCASAGRRR